MSQHFETCDLAAITAQTAADDAPTHEAMGVRVANSGIGIAPEHLGHLFEPIVQLGQHADPARRGLGLGLALARGLARLHGGDAWVESGGVGRGARFSLSIPLLTRNESAFVT